MDERFSANMKAARKKAGLTQVEAAKRLGVERSTIASWESGAREPGIDKIRKIAVLFKVSVDDLFGLLPKEVGGGQWFSLWLSDKQSIVETMARNMAADIAAGYSYFGNSIQKQKQDLEAYQKEYEDQMMAFSDMTDTQVERWCYFDLLRRGAITR